MDIPFLLFQTNLLNSGLNQTVINATFSHKVIKFYILFHLKISFYGFFFPKVASLQRLNAAYTTFSRTLLTGLYRLVGLEAGILLVVNSSGNRRNIICS